MEYSIVIPTYNEAGNITSSLTQVLGFMRSFSPSFEVVLVDDGSVDDTADIVKEYAISNPEIRLIKNPHLGKSGALITGVREASGQYICLVDADMATPISDLQKLSVWMKDQDFDVVIASREGPGAVRINEPFYRHFVGRVFNLLVRILTLPGIQDSQCGFKLYKSEVAKTIFSKLVVYGPNTKVIKKPFFGALDVEVLFVARKLGYKIKAVGITWTYVKTNRFNFLQNTYKMSRDLVLIRLMDLKGKYKPKTNHF